MNILFAYLNAFSAVGGIQKFNKNLLISLDQLSRNQSLSISSLGLYDKAKDVQGLARVNMSVCNESKILFLWKSLILFFKADQIIIGHINLLIPFVLFKKIFFSRKRIILVAHGIEVFTIKNYFHRKAILACDLVLPVSNFTKSKLISVTGLISSKLRVFPNTIDPNFIIKKCDKENNFFLKKYKIDLSDPIILTLARLDSSEQYKGYDKVIESLASVKENFPQIKYILAGKYDDRELHRIEMLIMKFKLEKNVILTGYVPDRDIPDLFCLCDLFILPSKREGFGIVFLEALAFGKPIIAGNMDGSVDALVSGELGILVNPDNINEIASSIINVLSGKVSARFYDSNYLKRRSESYFGFEHFTERLSNIIFS